MHPHNQQMNWLHFKILNLHLLFWLIHSLYRRLFSPSPCPSSFKNSDIKNILEEAKYRNYQVITTEKDYYKIKDFNIEKIEFLEVLLEINNKEKFIKTIEKLYVKNN